MGDLVICEVCERPLNEYERCYRYLGDGDEWFIEDTADAVELHTFCEVHAPDCVGAE